MKKLMWAIALCLSSGSLANADLVLNEVLASTTGADTEFIEIFNSGTTAVDISGWEVRQYESDAGEFFGDLDETNTITTGTIAAGDWFVIGNQAFIDAFGITPDVQDDGLSIENSSVTLELFDTVNSVSIFTAFLTDGGDGDAANIAGTAITADITVGPDGTFFPAGYYLNGDAGSTASLLEFAPTPAASATPGSANLNAIPEPSSVALIGLVGLGLGFVRRRN
jgi:hypothetical protein